jgi:hypothetical protein
MNYFQAIYRRVAENSIHPLSLNPFLEMTILLTGADTGGYLTRRVRTRVLFFTRGSDLHLSHKSAGAGTGTGVDVDFIFHS